MLSHVQRVHLPGSLCCGFVIRDRKEDRQAVLSLGTCAFMCIALLRSQYPISRPSHPAS